MASVKLTISRLNALKSSYKDTIKHSLDIDNADIEKERSELENKYTHDIKLAIIESMKDRGFNVVVSVNVDSSWRYATPKSTTVTISFDETPNIPELKKLETKKKKICEKYQKIYRDLNNWELNCIKIGEINDFKLPDVPNPKFNCG